MERRKRAEQKHRDYFEGVLQLRNPSQEVVDFVRQSVAKSGRARISKIKRVTNGIDVYLSCQHYLQSLGRQLKQRFCGELKLSRKLHTLDVVRSKRVYRVTVLFRMLPFKKGDLIVFDGEDCRILVIDNRVLCKGVKSGKKHWLSFEQAERMMKSVS